MAGYQILIIRIFSNKSTMNESGQVRGFLPLKNILMVKKLSGTDERNGGTTLNKSANIFVTNPANTICGKYADYGTSGHSFP